MLRKVTLAMLVLALVSQVAAAGAVKCALTATDPQSPANGTLHAANAKPSDTICRYRLSVAGLMVNPQFPYTLRVYKPGGYEWSLPFWTDEKGSFTQTGCAPDQVLSATNVEITYGSGNVVMSGKLQ